MRLIFFNIFIFIFCIFSIPSLAYAKNLGVWGSLFPIEEQDIREFIYQRLNEMEQNGEIAKLNEKFIKNVLRGISDTELKRFHSPIGLSNNAETPEEIAISIMAEIISVYRSGKSKKEPGCIL